MPLIMHAPNHFPADVCSSCYSCILLLLMHVAPTHSYNPAPHMHAPSSTPFYCRLLLMHAPTHAWCSYSCILLLMLKLMLLLIAHQHGLLGTHHAPTHAVCSYSCCMILLIKCILLVLAPTPACSYSWILLLLILLLMHNACSYYTHAPTYVCSSSCTPTHACPCSCMPLLMHGAPPHHGLGTCVMLLLLMHATTTCYSCTYDAAGGARHAPSPSSTCSYSSFIITITPLTRPLLVSGNVHFF